MEADFLDHKPLDTNWLVKMISIRYVGTYLLVFRYIVLKWVGKVKEEHIFTGAGYIRERFFLKCVLRTVLIHIYVLQSPIFFQELLEDDDDFEVAEPSLEISGTHA